MEIRVSRKRAEMLVFLLFWSTAKPMDYAIIVLLYAPERLISTVRIAMTLRRLLGTGRVIVVANDERITPVIVRDSLGKSLNVEWVKHDNTGLEFGGYQAGVDMLGTELPDRLIIINDTLGHHDLPTPTVLRCFVRQLSLDIRNFALGMLYSQPRTMILLGMQSSRWIRTHLFCIDREGLSALQRRIYAPEIDRLITASPDPEVFFGHEVNGGLRELLTHFLFRPGQFSWYAAAPLSAQNCVAMAGKARAILQEKYLTMRLESADASLWHIQLSRRERAKNLVEKSFLRFRRKLERIR
jgi:hypothetical protein